MYSQSDIEEAVAAGWLAPDQAANLRNYVAARNGAPTADEEYYRFVLGHRDILVTYTSFMVLFALGLIGLLIPVGTPRLGPIASLPPLTPVFVAAGAWGLSELFLKRRGFALAGIFLSLMLGLAVFFSLFLVGLLMIANSGELSPVGGGMIGAVGAAAASAATWLHWRRFGVPAAMSWYLGFGVLAVVCFILPVIAITPALGTVLPLILLVLGVGMFAYAMSWDTRDPHRVSVASEVGIWVHGLAAALISGGATGLLGIGNGVTTAAGSLGAIGLFVVLTLVGLVINRRQYVIAALSPLTALLIALFGNTARYAAGRSPFGNPYGPQFAPFTGDALIGTTATFCIIAVLMLLVVLFWQPLRRGVLALTPAGWRAHLPGTVQGPNS